MRPRRLPRRRRRWPAGAAAVACVGISLVRARRELDDKTAPMAGLVAAFIFAVQMLNFPVASGTSGRTCSVAPSLRSWSGRGQRCCA